MIREPDTKFPALKDYVVYSIQNYGVWYVNSLTYHRVPGSYLLTTRLPQCRVRHENRHTQIDRERLGKFTSSCAKNFAFTYGFYTHSNVEPPNANEPNTGKPNAVSYLNDSLEVYSVTTAKGILRKIIHDIEGEIGRNT